MSRAICLYLHVHQPHRIRPYSVFDSGLSHNYFFEPNPDGDTNNERIIHKVAEKSYRPMNRTLHKLIDHNPDFKFSLSITGTLIQQLEWWAPDVLADFQSLVSTGRVEILAETFHHSLAFFFDRQEFEHQVDLHRTVVEKYFGVTPTAFRNTELSYNNDLAYWADKAGYKAIITEGWDPVLGWRSPNFVYRPSFTDNIRLMLKNYRLSDDIAFRFSSRGWSGWPLTADKYVGWLNDYYDQPLINLFMDYETFGEHQWADTGIFDFMEALPAKWQQTEGHTFMTITEASQTFEPVDQVDMPRTVTWADTERDLSAWLDNPMQHEAVAATYALGDRIRRLGDLELAEDWRRLQTSDHFYYMCTKWFNDGDVHAYFSPYKSPYEAFIYHMNVLRDLELRIAEEESKRR